MRKKTQQQLYFVTHTNLISHDYIRPLGRYNNKFLTAISNTFEEYIILDGDAVPFIQLKPFFDIDEYKKSGHYMFCDRELGRTSSEKYVASYTGAFSCRVEFNQFFNTIHFHFY